MSGFQFRFWDLERLSFSSGIVSKTFQAWILIPIPRRDLQFRFRLDNRESQLNLNQNNSLHFRLTFFTDAVLVRWPWDFYPPKKFPVFFSHTITSLFLQTCFASHHHLPLFTARRPTSPNTPTFFTALLSSATLQILSLVCLYTHHQSSSNVNRTWGLY